MIIPFRVNPETVIASQCADNRNTTYYPLDFPEIHEALNNPKVIVVPDLPESFTSERSFANWCTTSGILPRRSPRPDGSYLTERDLAIYAPHNVAVELETIEMEWEERAPRLTHEEFTKAQKAGEILVSPLAVGKLVFKDSLFVDIPTGSFEHYALHTTSVDHREFVLGCHPVMQDTYRYPHYEDGMVSQVAKPFDYYHLDKLPVYYAWVPNARVTTLFSEMGKPDLKALREAFSSVEISSNLHNEALDELHSGLYDLGVELAELRETVKYGFSLLRRVLDAYLSLRRNTVKVRRTYKSNAVELSKALAGLWMEFRYAVTPMVRSFEDWQDYHFSLRRAFVTVRKRLDVPFEFTQGQYTYKGTVETRVWAKGSFDTDAALSDLGMNPLKALWEITPYAFIVGWILPIGNMLGALVPPTNTTQRKLTHSLRMRELSVEVDGRTYQLDCDLYQVTEQSPTISWGLSADISINWKRQLDALSLSWLLATSALDIK